MKKSRILPFSLLMISVLLVSCGQDTPTTVDVSEAAVARGQRSDKSDRSDKSGKSEKVRTSVHHFPPLGAQIRGAFATLERDDDDEVEVKMTTRGLIRGNAYTLWAFVNFPPLPGEGPLLVEGLVARTSRRTRFEGEVNSTDRITVLVLLDHGPRDPSLIPDQLETPAGGTPVQRAVFP